MKKQLLILSLAVTLMAGCKKDDEVKTGNVEVTVSYFYNDFQGYKPDVGASIYLFKHTGASYEQNLTDFRIGYLTIEGTDETVKNNFSAEANVNGVASIKNVPYGKYLLVASSEGRYSYSYTTIEVNSPDVTFVKNFGYLDEYDDDGESW